MAENDPELQARLQELDHELEEGELTRKGYEKRRTKILSHYFAADPGQPTLRLHSVEEDPIPSPSDGLRGGATAQHVARPASSVYTASVYSRRDTNATIRPPSPHGDRSNVKSTLYPPHQQRVPGARNTLHLPSGSHTPEDNSRRGTMQYSDFAFNPAHSDYSETTAVGSHESPGGTSRLSTMADTQQGYFADFAGQQMQEETRDSYGGPIPYGGDGFSPSAVVPPPMLSASDLPGPGVADCMMPLEPRDVPFDVYDPHNGNVRMSQFDTIGAVLRHRGKANSKQIAFWVLDPKGKELGSITWEKFHSRSEKVAQVIKDKSNLYRGDRVALVYRDAEVIEFAVALMGCYLAGVVAVPMNNVEDYNKLILLLTTTQAHLALTTDNNLKAFHRDISTQRLKWPTGVEWWKTNEFGSHNPKKKDNDPAQPPPDLAYIEFSRAPTGDLRGVVLSHRTIMHQMACLQAVVSTIGNSDGPNARQKAGAPLTFARSHGETILTYLDPREGIGLIMGVLFGTYGGHTTVWMESKTVDTPGLYAHLISKYKTTIMIADYPGLKRAVYNYQQDPMATRGFKKNMEPNFSSVKVCFIDTLTVDCEFHEVLADRWLKPMRNPIARQLVAPMLALPEHGGMVISVRDWLGGEERMGFPLSAIEPEDTLVDRGSAQETTAANGYSSLIGGGPKKKIQAKTGRKDLSVVLIDKEALKVNEILVIATGEEADRRANEPGVMRIGAFGYPIPDATLALVDPETSLLCAPNTIGEIWVDSPSLSGGFWALPKHTESIFHARPYRFIADSPTPIIVEPEFLRTGLLGCVIEGKIFVLGLYEDRIRQRVEWVESGVTDNEHRYFFVQHLVTSIMKAVPKIYDCSAFDSHVNGEYLPFILLETQAASTAPTTQGGPPRQLDIPFLDSLSERVMEILYQEHHLRVYCVMITAPNQLPRIMKNGRREIGNMLCRREFDNGTLPCVHVKFGVERAVQNLPLGDDPSGGVWSPLAAQLRQQLLAMQDKQYSGVDPRDVVMDDRTSTPLNQFSNIQDLMQWRVQRQSDELGFCTVDQRGKEGKGIPWKKFDLKVAAVAMYLKNKVKVQPGDHLLLMYTHSEDFIFAVFACFCIGAVAIPMAPLDANRLNEDAPALLHIIADFKIKALIVNSDVDHLLKQKPVSQHLKQSAQVLKISVPSQYNTSKPSKQSHGCKQLGLSVKPAWTQSSWPVLVWVYWTPDQRRQAVQLGHDTIMALCKVQKETCQMPSSRPVLGCVRSTMGLGFIHTVLMGVFLGTPTYLLSPVDFAGNPNILFQTLSRYKIKDAYATSQMLDHSMAHGAGRGTSLVELKNLMISTEGRPRVDIYQKVRLHFAQAGLDRTAINTIYSHMLNPMVVSRSYMCIEPVELWLDMNGLRRGLIIPVDPTTNPTALQIQDSGMVPVSTQISIVNPETNQLCLVGEYGEVWVHSEANAHAFYGSKDPFDAERFNGRILDADPTMKYVRTGDLGFLHTVSRPIGPGGAPVEMQILFVLGSIGETFDVHGLNHFPMDIERSVESCHRNIVPGGSAVFQAGGLVVVLVEVFRKNFLASIVPVIVNAVLNHHHLVVDIVAFVSKGDFPRSRLGEKQRGKILASWVTRKLRTIAQFGIREPAGGLGMGEIDEGMKNGRRVSSMSSGQQHSMSMGALQQRNSLPRSSTQEFATDSPNQVYQDSIAELPGEVHSTDDEEIHELGDESTIRSDDTPTQSAPGPGHLSSPATWHNHSQQIDQELDIALEPTQQPNPALEYSPIDSRGPFSGDPSLEDHNIIDPTKLGNIDEIPLPLHPGRPAPNLPGSGQIPISKNRESAQSAKGHKPRPSEDMMDDDWKKEVGMYVNFTGGGR